MSAKQKKQVKKKQVKSTSAMIDSRIKKLQSELKRLEQSFDLPKYMELVEVVYKASDMEKTAKQDQQLQAINVRLSEIYKAEKEKEKKVKKQPAKKQVEKATAVTEKPAKKQPKKSEPVNTKEKTKDVKKAVEKPVKGKKQTEVVEDVKPERKRKVSIIASNEQTSAGKRNKQYVMLSCSDFAKKHKLSKGEVIRLNKFFKEANTVQHKVLTNSDYSWIPDGFEFLKSETADFRRIYATVIDGKVRSTITSYKCYDLYDQDDPESGTNKDVKAGLLRLVKRYSKVS